MSLEELSKFTITQKYAKFIPELNRRETWDEIVNRSLNMHLRRFDTLEEQDKETIKEVFSLVKEKKILPSMRGMQFAGQGVESKNERQFNCCFLHIHNTRCIEKAFYLLLCGVGCGFGLRNKWVSQFPKLVIDKTSVQPYTIPDSIEGWATSTKALIDSYLEGNAYTGKQIKFDYSQIRPKGSPISHGGTAPGPEGLRHAHKQIEKLLRSLSNGSKLRTIDVYDILMHTADAVLSGGIRRAASIALFEFTDELMMSAKTGNWFVENPQRARSNNTVILKRDEVTFDQLSYIIESTRQWGEPGFAFMDDLDTGTNPCAEVGLFPFWNGEPAVQFCNLTTINGNTIESIEDFLTLVRAASIIGTLQADYTDFKFLDKADVGITKEEALLGVSILGYMANPEVLLNPVVLRKGAELAVKTNEEWAAKLGIKPAARVTCTKPDGNSSCVIESAFSGIHPAHAQKYFRRVQVNKDDPVYVHFKKYNPQLCEESIYSATNTDDVIVFPIDVDNDHGMFKDDLPAVDHLDMIKMVQQAWVNGGAKNNTKPTSHAVSCTVLVGEDEWDGVVKYIYDNRDSFTNVSLLARSGDKDYAQAPYEAVTTEEDYERWIYARSSFQPVDYTLMHEDSDNTQHSQEVACAGGMCTI